VEDRWTVPGWCGRPDGVQKVRVLLRDEVDEVYEPKELAAAEKMPLAFLRAPAVAPATQVATKKRVPEAAERESAGAGGMLLPGIVQWNDADHHLLLHEMVMRGTPGALDGRE
jgi:hypothetical protein